MTTARHNSAPASEVIVVGAGPVGMAAALALRSLGREVTVLEAGAKERLRPGSRAIFVHRETITILERFSPGLGRKLVEHGLVWPTKRTLYRGREVFRRTYPPPVPGSIPQFTSLPQIETERHLLAACQANGVHFEWEAEVAGVEVDPIAGASSDTGGTGASGGTVPAGGTSGVTLTLHDGTTRSAPFVIGADGARSAVRKSLGIEMEGSRSEGYYIVVDVEEDPDDPRPIERVFHYGHPGIDHRNVLVVPFAGGWRIDLQLKETDDPEVFGDKEGVREWLPRVMDAKYADRLGWISSYQFLQILARRFADPSGRVLLIGEAAHLFAPFGARGMNSGVADADAAATAIHLALDATNPARATAAVEHFSRTRIAAAKFNRAAAGSALTHLRPSAMQRAKQEGAARLSRVVPAFGAWLERAPYGPRHGAGGREGGRY